MKTPVHKSGEPRLNGFLGNGPQAQISKTIIPGDLESRRGGRVMGDIIWVLSYLKLTLPGKAG